MCYPTLRLTTPHRIKCICCRSSGTDTTSPQSSETHPDETCFQMIGTGVCLAATPLQSCIHEVCLPSRSDVSSSSTGRHLLPVRDYGTSCCDYRTSSVMFPWPHSRPSEIACLPSRQHRSSSVAHAGGGPRCSLGHTRRGIWTNIINGRLQFFTSVI